MSIKALQLNHEWLGKLIRFTDWEGNQIVGRLEEITIHADERTRVRLRVAIEFATDKGGTYWSSFGNDQYVNRDAIVEEAS